MPPPPPPRSTRPAAPALDFAPRTPRPICPRIVLYACEKFGKTTFAVHAPNPILLMAKGETGYDTLLSAGLAPAIPAMVIESWEHALDTLDALVTNSADRQTVILDALGGFDILAQTHVCNTQFGGSWNDPRDGFLAYGAERGHRATALEWDRLLARLDTLNQRGLTVVLIGHATRSVVRNPMGADYDTYTADLNKHSWALTARWSDCILHGQFYTEVDADRKAIRKGVKGKATGGTDRIIYTRGTAAFVAGNRYSMMPEMLLTDVDAHQMWDTVWNEIVRSKRGE
jgi:hypothetical protein